MIENILNFNKIMIQTDIYDFDLNILFFAYFTW